MKYVISKYLLVYSRNMLGLDFFKDVAYGGVDHKLPGNGGQQCVDFLSLEQRVYETIIMELLAFVILLKALPNVSLPEKVPPCRNGTGTGRTLLLLVLVFTFGLEVGFKLATKSIIYLLNPCHILTTMQIYLLAARPSKIVMVVYRISNYLLFGALLAVVFPVLNTRELPGEVCVYWVQHVLILAVVPIYLLTCGGPYTMEPFSDWSWVAVTYTIFSFYMMIVLQILGMISHVNLNSSICPAVSDPFNSKYFRMIGLVHQTALIFVFGKLVNFVGNAFVQVCYGSQMQ